MKEKKEGWENEFGFKAFKIQNSRKMEVKDVRVKDAREMKSDEGRNEIRVKQCNRKGSVRRLEAAQCIIGKVESRLQ